MTGLKMLVGFTSTVNGHLKYTKECLVVVVLNAIFVFILIGWSMSCWYKGMQSSVPW